MLTLNSIDTVAFAAAVLLGGYALRRIVPGLARYNIPAPVVGGVTVAMITLVAQQLGNDLWKFDTSLKEPLMIAFFTSIGFGASLSLLRRGGPQVIRLLVLATLVAVIQNLVGVALAAGIGQSPLLGIVCGAVTLAGGPATSLAFGPEFERAGLSGASTIGLAAAIAGILVAGLVGGPLGTILLRRHGLSPAPAKTDRAPFSLPEAERHGGLLKAVLALLLAMWAGSWVRQGLDAIGWTLPAYIGAMIVAAAIRNIDDRWPTLRLSTQTMAELGSVTLSLFLVLALITLDLQELARLALPMCIILSVQVIVTTALCAWPIFPLLGHDYEAALMSSGCCGFMLGTTANAMANLESLAQRYGPAPRAFLAVPIVGAFFLDFTNALVITASLALWR